MKVSEMIAVMQAHADGKPVQFVRRNVIGDPWLPAGNPVWNWVNYTYRVAPLKPAVLYINEYSIDIHVHHSAARARHCAGADAKRVAVKYIEVTPDVEVALRKENITL